MENFILIIENFNKKIINYELIEDKILLELD